MGWGRRRFADKGWKGPGGRKALLQAAKMFGLGKEDLSEDDWAAFIRIVQALERKNGGKEEATQGLIESRKNYFIDLFNRCFDSVR